MANEKESNAMFWGFVLGAIGGAAFALLRTPRSGREIRGEITSQASRLTSRGQQTTSYTWQPPGSVQQQAADVAETVQQQAASATAAASDLQEEMASSVKAAQEQASDVVDAAGEAVDEVGQATDDLTGA